MQNGTKVSLLRSRTSRLMTNSTMMRSLRPALGDFAWALDMMHRSSHPGNQPCAPVRAKRCIHTPLYICRINSWRRACRRPDLHSSSAAGSAELLVSCSGGGSAAGSTGGGPPPSSASSLKSSITAHSAIAAARLQPAAARLQPAAQQLQYRFHSCPIPVPKDAAEITNLVIVVKFGYPLCNQGFHFR